MSIGDRRTRAVLTTVGLCGTLSVGLWATVLRSVGSPTVPTGPRLSWYALAAMFALTEVVVLHVQIRREAQTISLSEVPLILGLVFAGPVAMVTGRLLGSALVFAAHRRQSTLKIGCNIVMQTAEVSAALAAYRAVSGGAAPLEPRGLLACYAGAVAAALTSGLATRLVIGMAETGLRARDFGHEIVSYPPLAAAVATFAIVAVYALVADARSCWVLLVCMMLLLAGYRAYARLAERHLGLERLYQFTQAVSTSPEIDEVLISVLAQAKEMLRSERAHIVFLSAHDDRRVARATLRPDHSLRRQEVTLDLPELALERRVADSGEPQLVARGARDAALRSYLGATGLREAIVVPLRGATGVIGTLTVADRMGDVRTFDDNDVQLLLTVANHASVALRNGELIDQLRHDALHDNLTSLPNRAMFERLGMQLLDEVTAGELPAVAVAILDLDGFKDVNDTLGHQYGDQLLVHVGNRLREACGDAFIARLGGDEFAFLAPGIADEAEALALAERLRSMLEQPVALEDVVVEVRASMGVALAPGHGRQLSGLLKRADIAMYDAKNSGTGVRLFDESLDDHSPSRLRLVSELRGALSTGEVTIEVQPKVRLDNGSVAGVEALVRWTHPEHGPLSPTQFVAIAERNGLIRPLTHRVLDEALAACASWVAAGLRVPISVNISPRALLDPDLVTTVLGALSAHDLPAGLLTLEITESSVMADPDRAIAALHELRRAGIGLSVDDFGTGYSSLSYLKRLPVQEVKIDRSFVVDLAQGGDGDTIVRSIVDLGTNLGLDVIAEGVEDLSTWQRLRELRCTQAQGFFVSRPLPVAELADWLARHEAATRTASSLLAHPRTPDHEEPRTNRGAGMRVTPRAR